MSSDHYDRAKEAHEENQKRKNEKSEAEHEELPRDLRPLVQKVLDAETFLARIGSSGYNAAFTISPDAIERLLSGEVFPFEMDVSFGKGKKKQHRKIKVNVMMNNTFANFFNQFS